MNLDICLQKILSLCILNFLRNCFHPSFWSFRHLIQDIFKALSKILKYIIFKPPCLVVASIISFLYLAGLLFQIKFLNILSSYFIVISFGVGRDNRICVIFEINRLLISVILPVSNYVVLCIVRVKLFQ